MNKIFGGSSVIYECKQVFQSKKFENCSSNINAGFPQGKHAGHYAGVDYILFLLLCVTINPPHQMMVFVIALQDTQKHVEM